MTEMAFDLDIIKKKMLRKYPAFGSTILNTKYQIVGNDHPVKTAATDGKNIYVNTDFMAGLSETEQVFTMAHEVCHIALKHIERSKDKDQMLWNIATDAVINQHLKKDGLSMPKGGVDIVDALKYDAEELYQKLLAEKEKQQQQQKQQNSQNKQNKQSDQQQGQNGQNKQSDQQNQYNSQGQGQTSNQDQQQGKNKDQQGSGQGQSQKDLQVGHDDHSMWEEAVKQQKHKSKGTGLDEQNQSQEDEKINEKQIFEKNKEQIIKRAEEIMRKINGTRRGLDGQSQEVYFDNIGKAAKPVTNWKKLLVKTLEIEDESWGHKFSDRASGYAARIEDVEYDEKAETEIILDTSGSVSVDLLKSFLRQVKTVLKNSTIKVGTFSNDFHGFVQIKRESDIDNLKIRVGGGTNFDAASRAFTKRKDVNKICFTDGQDGGDAEIQDKRKDIVWISFENPNFKPDYGKVLFVPKSQINLKKYDEPKFTM